MIPLVLAKAHHSAVPVPRRTYQKPVPLKRFWSGDIHSCLFSINSTTPTTSPLGNAGGLPTTTPNNATYTTPTTTPTTTGAKKVGGLGGAMPNLSPRMELAGLVIVGSSLAALFI